MDKLKPLIAHKFWIFFVIALLMPTAGWWMATGDLITKISAKEKEIKETNPYKGTGANPSWLPKVKEYVETAQMQKDKAAALLQGTQQGLRVWPKGIAHLVQDIPYFGDIENKDIRDWYRDVYFKEVERVRKIVNPFDPETNQGTVILERDDIPFVPYDRWQFISPTSQEMWEEQEDLWLYTELLLAIAAVNEESDALTESPVRQIMEITLAGGDRSTLTETKGVKTGGPGSGADFVEIQGDFPGPARGGKRLGPGRSAGNVDITPAQVFGPATATRGGAGGGQTTAEGDPGETKTAPMPGGGPGAQRTKVRRYVDDEEGAPFKTRGFKLSVIMDHTRLPELLVQLTNSKWPVEIVHVNQVAYNRDDEAGKRSQPRYKAPNRFDNPASTFDPGGMEESVDAGAYETPQPAYAGSAGQGARSRTAGSSAAAAMADPVLAHVVIFGLMTIYEPPAEKQQAEGQPAGDAAAPQQKGQPAPGPEADAAPAEPQPAQDGTEPAESEPKQAASEPEEKSDTPTEPDTPTEKKPE